MSGNCATGSFTNATAPATSIISEMTLEKMGRSIKNRKTSLVIFLGWAYSAVSAAGCVFALARIGLFGRLRIGSRWCVGGGRCVGVSNGTASRTDWNPSTICFVISVPR